MTTQSGQPATRRFGTSAVIITAVIGGLVVIALAFSGIVASLDRGPATATHTANADGVTALQVDSSRGEITVEFGAVSEAHLDVAGGDKWTLERAGDTLTVKSDRGFLDWGIWGFDLCIGGCGVHEATLTLPLELEGIDADLSLSAGGLYTTGEFRDLRLDVSAGEAIVSGEARSIDVDLSAGSATVDVANAREASFDLSAGSADVVLTGTPPVETEVQVSAGSFDLTLPDVPYAVSSDVSAGDLDNEVRTDPSARHRVTVDLSAGSASIRPGK